MIFFIGYKFFFVKTYEYTAGKSCRYFKNAWSSRNESQKRFCEKATKRFRERICSHRVTKVTEWY